MNLKKPFYKDSINQKDFINKSEEFNVIFLEENFSSLYL